jgi:hypothetical protein
MLLRQRHDKIQITRYFYCHHLDALGVLVLLLLLLLLLLFLLFDHTFVHSSTRFIRFERE